MSIYNILSIIENKLNRSWREPEPGPGPASGCQTTALEDSQLGQLLLYLLAVQVKRLQAVRHLPGQRPTPVLGLFMDNLQACIYH